MKEREGIERQNQRKELKERRKGARESKDGGIKIKGQEQRNLIVKQGMKGGSKGTKGKEQRN